MLEGKLCLNGFQHWLWHEIQFNLSAQAKTTPEEEQRERPPTGKEAGPLPFPALKVKNEDFSTSS